VCACAARGCGRRAGHERGEGRCIGGLAEMAEQSADAGRIGDQRAQLHAPATHGTLVNFELKAALHQLGPRPPTGAVRGRLGRHRRLRRRGLRLRGHILLSRRLVMGGWRRHHQRAPLGSGSEHSSVSHGVEPWRWHSSSESAQQRQRIDVDGDGAVAEGAAKLDADETAIEQLESLVGDGGTQHVAHQRIAAALVIGIGRSGGVQREAELQSSDRVVSVKCGRETATGVAPGHREA